MRGNFIIGLALGAVAGMVAIDSSTKIKTVFQKSKENAIELAHNATNMQGNQN